MFRNIRKKIVLLLSAFTLVAVPLAVPALVSAEASIQTCLSQGSGLTVPENNADCVSSPGESGGQGLNDIIKLVINSFSVLVAVVAVIMIIYGGFRYITSGGDSAKITSAKNTIIYAIIGLIVVALAQIIVKFVLGKIAPNA